MKPHSFKKNLIGIGFQLTLLSLLSYSAASSPLYPIIMVHGFFGNADLWEPTVSGMQECYDWIPSRPSHICVNRSPDSTSTGADLYLQFPEPTHLDQADLYRVDFFNWMEGNEWRLHKLHLPTWSQGHSSAPMKQGAALAQLIPAVLEVTGSDKVILLCHSMGGLAAREYLQRLNEDGSPRWWPDSTHHVHQLITIGTPHFGSNILNLNIPFQKEEGLRDVRYSWDSILSWPPDSARDRNVYLFGGMESSIPESFYNRDVDCNGIAAEEKWIRGLNSYRDGMPVDNPEMPLPDDVIYSWIVSETMFNSDGVVRTDRQHLPGRGSVINTSSNHAWIWRETGDLPAFMQALDLPDGALTAPSVEIGRQYEEPIWHLEQSLDFDWIQLPSGTRILLVNPRQSDLSRIWLMYPERTETFEVDAVGQQLLEIDPDNPPRVCFSGPVQDKGWRQCYSFSAIP